MILSNGGLEELHEKALEVVFCFADPCTDFVDKKSSLQFEVL